MEAEIKKAPFHFREIGLADKEFVEEIFNSTGVVSNFTCFPQFYAYLAKPSNHLYAVNFGGKPRIILHRNSNLNDVRIMFSKDEKDGELIEEIKKKFNPKYIAYNLISEKPYAAEPNKTAIRDELILDVPTVANLDDTRVKKDYNRCKTRHPDIQYRPATPEDRKQLVDFVDRWCQRETGRRDAPVTGENVKRYIDLFLDKDDIIIGVIIDKEKVIGITSHSSHPSDQKLAVSTFSMVDRGYKELGVFTHVEHAKAMLLQGYDRTLIGGRENIIVDGKEDKGKAYFKMKFMKKGTIDNYYSLEIYRDPSLSTTPNYLRDFWA